MGPVYQPTPTTLSAAGRPMWRPAADRCATAGRTGQDGAHEGEDRGAGLSEAGLLDAAGELIFERGEDCIAMPMASLRPGSARAPACKGRASTRSSWTGRRKTCGEPAPARPGGA